MKKRTIQLIAISLAIVSGAALLYERQIKTTAPISSLPAAGTNSKPPENAQTTLERPAIPSPAPANARHYRMPAPKHIAETPLPEKRAVDPSMTAQQRNALVQQWKRAEERFNRQWDLLEREQEPANRTRLIQGMAQYVRMDTMAAIEWALGLENPAERQQALEAINQYALTGIGAMIAKDETGFPLIRDTTVVSAAAATGLVEPGDYIIGMQNENGDIVSFEGMTVHEIVHHLRGKAGTDILLYIERVAEQGKDSYVFDVPVQRSLIVIQPPY